MMRGEATRAAIIEGAIAAIAIGGVAGATTRVIAREAAVRLATIHHHFPTKDALLAAVLEALAGQLGCALREAVRDAPGVAGLLRAAWRFAEQTLDLQRAQYELTLYALRTPDAAWLAERQYAAYLRIYADALGTDDTTSARAHAGRHRRTDPAAHGRWRRRGVPGDPGGADPRACAARRTGRRLIAMMAPLADAAELCRLGVADLTAGYATGRFSPVEVARACLDRAAVVQHRCNAFVFVDEAGALAAAAESETRWRSGTPASRIDGAPTTLKDIVGVRDWTLTYGSRAADPVHSREDAPAVALLRQAGAVFLGLTRMPEFGWKAVTDSPAGGITRNPRDPSLTAGGSSGGAAAAAASGAGVLHLGTDGGGSIRIPAAFCGVVGHKPTFGRVPAWPPSAFGTVAHLGPITRSVADAMAMLDVMSGRDLRDWHQTVMPFPPVTGARCELAGLRLGVWDVSPGVGITSAIAASFSVACARLTAAGALLEPVALPPEDLDGPVPHVVALRRRAAAADGRHPSDITCLIPGLPPPRRRVLPWMPVGS